MSKYSSIFNQPIDHERYRVSSGQATENTTAPTGYRSRLGSACAPGWKIVEEDRELYYKRDRSV